MLLDDMRKEENSRDDRLHSRLCDSIKKKSFNVAIAQAKGKNVSQKMYDKFMITPIGFLERSYVRVSLTSLYRRYRQIEMKVLVEVLGILGRSDTIDEARRIVHERLVATSKMHIASRERRKK